MSSSSARGWFSLLLCLLIVNTVRAGGHLIRLALLALVLWCLHQLAQDFQKIRKGLFGRSLLRIARDAPEALTEFHISPYYKDEVDFLDGQLENILKQDPKNCVKSFICQIAAMNQTSLRSEELDILNFLKSLNLNRRGATQEFQKALIKGTTSRNVKDCRKMYKTCPFDAESMLSLLRTVTT